VSDLAGSAELRALCDRQAIWDCLMRYCRGVDRLDADLVRSAYWPDAHDSHGAVSGTPEEFLTKWIPTQAVREAAQHAVTNHTVVLDGDLARAETYFSSAMKNAGSNTLRLVAGRYLDTFERRGSEWRIRGRLVVLDWQADADARRMTEVLDGRVCGRRDRHDPSYDLFCHTPTGEEQDR
jgi:hypothetical protein